jgi:hypothetical protein
MMTRTSESMRRSGWILLVTTFVMLAEPAAAQQRIQFLNEGRGVRDLSGPQSENVTGPARTALVQGPLTYDRGSGLRIGNLSLRITSGTVIDAGSAGSALSYEPGRLAGRRATVFGHSRGKLLEARMVILEPELTGVDVNVRKRPVTARWAEAASTGASAGRLLADAPH